MDLPEFIKVGDYEVHYKDLNDYQISIYQMLALYVQMLNRTAVDVSGVTEEQKEFLRTAGVVGFLRSRLDEYGDIEKVPRNLYESWESQFKSLLDPEESKQEW